MAEGSAIEWTDATWNPIVGCSVISPGCTNCYAMRLAARLARMNLDKYKGSVRRSGSRDIWTGRITVDASALSAPLNWRRPRRVFVNSMSDLFHEGVPPWAIKRVWSVMAEASQHTFQVLTKRPTRMAELLTECQLPPLPHVWLGTSVELASCLDRIDVLRLVPAAVRFVSFEPLLGPIAPVDLSGIQWAIVGGESGPGARKVEHSWIEGIRESCDRQGVAFFFKQWGGVQKHRTGRVLNGRTYDSLPNALALSE